MYFSDVCKLVFPLMCELWLIYFAHVAIDVKVFLMNLNDLYILDIKILSFMADSNIILVVVDLGMFCRLCLKKIVSHFR